MPKRTDISSILIIGAGPIVIGQACEFDYSGTQACKALKAEGYRVVLVNSNPATIMTDPDLADATYIEPITPEIVAKIIEKERPDALLPTMGGQTALNTALSLRRMGVLDKFDVKMIGATADAIDKAEDRERFREAMTRIGLETPRSHQVKTLPNALKALEDIGLPAIIRPSFTLGGTGGGIAYNKAEFIEIVERGIDASPTNEVLIEESVLGWKEFEMEVVRDKNDNCIIICSIENLDPMGVHTGDSITIAPALTLTDKEYQIMRDASIAVLREIGVETGGSNVQFAVNPADGRLVIIEMNPRVSRSSALASKATGFPIAKVAAKLAVGYTLDEIANDITGGATPASFEPTIDYVVTKIPRFAFEKFPGADPVLTTSMKSVGEAMAIGRTFQESLQKALRSLETGLTGLDEVTIEGVGQGDDRNAIRAALGTPTPDRLLQVAQAMRLGMSRRAHPRRLPDRSLVPRRDPRHRRDGSRDQGQGPADQPGHAAPPQGDGVLGRAARGAHRARRGGGHGGAARARRAAGVQAHRHLRGGVRLAHRLHVFDLRDAVRRAAGRRGGALRQEKGRDPRRRAEPHRPGHRVRLLLLSRRLRAARRRLRDHHDQLQSRNGVDRLRHLGPALFRAAHRRGRARDHRHRAGERHLARGDRAVRRPDAAQARRAARARQRSHPRHLARRHRSRRGPQPLQAPARRLGLKQPSNGIAYSVEQARLVAADLGYPIVVRPSYVLGGRAMQIIREEEQLGDYLLDTLPELVPHDVKARYPNDKTGQINTVLGKNPLLFDRYLSDAVEVDVDCLCDGRDTFIAGIMEHIEEAGIHSGDSACSLPPHNLKPDTIAALDRQTRQLALALKVGGLMNVQYAIKDGDIYVLEVNPRASRTVPFVAKVVGLPVAKIAARIMAGEDLASFKLEPGRFAPGTATHTGVKEAVFPFARFGEKVDTVLGPEMKSTGEVMGIDRSFDLAFVKSQLGGGARLPRSGTVFVSVRDEDKERVIGAVRTLAGVGFRVIATSGTQRFLVEHGVAADRILKASEGRPNVVDAIKNGRVQLVFNTTEGAQALADSKSLRRAALLHKVPYYTTLSGAVAAAQGIKAYLGGDLEVRALQSYFGGKG